LGTLAMRGSIKGGWIVEYMARHETCCLRQLSGDRGGEVQAGRFFANSKVTTAKIVDGWSEATTAAVSGRHVLAMQDTTAVTFATGDEAKSAKAGRTTRRGLGPLNEGSAYGILAHVMLAVDAHSHACLGLVGGEVWNRPGFVSAPEWSRPLAERESRRWVETVERAAPVLAEASQVSVASVCLASHSRLGCGCSTTRGCVVDALSRSPQAAITGSVPTIVVRCMTRRSCGSCGVT
jgi:hypothetical protein